jgi:hypothetical protein
VALRQEELDELWDFDDPVASEGRLRAAVDAQANIERRAELRTQVARALGLQARYPEADALLDSIEADGSEPRAAVRTRIALERGRLRNSAGDPAAAVPLFADAARIAESAGLDFLHVDALHMLAIADTAHSESWVARALDRLEGLTDPRTLRWRVSLHNNRGWSRFDAGDLEAALEDFEAALDAAERFGTSQQVRWANEAIAECRAALAARGTG